MQSQASRELSVASITWQMNKIFRHKDPEAALEAVVDGNLQGSYPMEDMYKVRVLIQIDLIHNSISIKHFLRQWLKICLHYVDGRNCRMVSEQRRSGQTGNAGDRSDTVSNHDVLNRVGSIFGWK